MQKLIDLIESICATYDDKSFKPRDGVTFCNMASASVAGQVGCNSLYGLVANDIYDLMKNSPEWSAVDNWTKAQDLANGGSLVFAAQKAEAHGHICVIRPGLMKSAARWNCRVPACMNIGETCFIDKGINWAFAEPPTLFVWRPSL